MKAVVVLFLLYLASSNACKCLVTDRTTPEFLCDLDYVLRGEVVKDTLISNKSIEPEIVYRVYTTKVQEIYKGLDKIRNINGGNTSYIQIKTPEESGACGVTMPLHKDLVIAGRLHGMVISNRHCSGWVHEWQTLSDSFKRFIQDIKQPSSTCNTGSCNTGSVLFLVAVMLNTYIVLYYI